MSRPTRQEFTSAAVTKEKPAHVSSLCEAETQDESGKYTTNSQTRRL